MAYPVLRDYQEKAINGLRDLIARGYHRTVLVMPTGAGKSIVFGQVIRNALDKGKTVLWLVHRRNLVYQMADVLRSFDIEPGIIMSQIKSDTAQSCQIGTIQTYSRRLQLGGPFVENRFFIDADLVLIDEGHRSVSPTYKHVISLYTEKILLTCTATPMRADGRGLSKVYDSLFDVIGVQELTDREFLAPARYFAPSIPDLSDVQVKMGDYVVSQLEKKVNQKKINGDVVENWLEKGENRKTLVFAVNVKHSIALRDEFLSRGIQTEHLDAKSNDDVREDVFNQLNSGKIRVITNVGIYTEGLDVPDISCCVIARPTRSMGLYRQMAGRSLRPSTEAPDTLIFDHGGVIREHGFLEDLVEWSLDGRERAWRKPSSKEKITRLVKCRVCHELFKGRRTCPRCGTELKTYGRKIQGDDQELVELKAKKKTNKELSWETKRQFMGALVWYARKKGYNEGWCAHSYRDLFGVWPNDSRLKNVAPIEPTGKIKNLLTHLLIKKAKRYQKEQAAHG